MCHPMHREKTCSATCIGLTNEWKSFQGNGVATTGKLIPNALAISGVDLHFNEH